MANNKTLLKAIERKEKQIEKQQKKAKWAKSQADRDKARDEIVRLSTERMRMKQQIRFNNAMSN